ncbi:MAG: choice-of-anchor J domain-containing protein, partial [Bacteroidia bacterium]
LQQMNTNPEFRTNQQLLEQYTQDFIKNNPAQHQKTASSTYIIPIVFHVIHTGGTGNISDAQIIDQVNIMNKEFPRQQADTSMTPGAFKPMAAPFSVEFRLPTIDPYGNCTNGIERIYSALANCSYTWDDVKALSDWPSNKYLNVWLVQSMHYPGNMTCNGGGYSQFPGGPANTDGIVILSDLIGSIGTAQTTSWGNWKGRYLIHEVGHWFNLRHIWGDATCGNDFVSDTPPAVTSNSGCSSFPHNANNSCGSGPDGEMYTDYMDYSSGYCLNMFTAGQVARMTAAITSTISGRNNIYSPANLIATGTGNPYTYPVACVGTPAMLSYGPIVACAGDSVPVTDYYYGGKSTSRLWNFYGQPSSSLTDSLVRVKYNTPGIYNISLTENYASAAKTSTFTNKVYVLSPLANPNYTVPFTESFENVTNFNNDWVAVNSENDSITWRNMNNTYYTGSRCVGIHNYENMAPSLDELISPAYNMGTASTATLSFRLHFATQTVDDYDKMSVYMSSNCGGSWILKYSKTVAALKTVTPTYTVEHVPAPTSGEWRQETISLTNSWGSNPVRFKFSFTSGGGNNIFIDDINISSAVSTGIQNETFVNNVSIYPNPASDQLFIRYDMQGSGTSADVEIRDVTGRLCAVQKNEALSTGTGTSINIGGLSNGVYMLSLVREGTLIYTTKFIKQKAD